MVAYLGMNESPGLVMSSPRHSERMSVGLSSFNKSETGMRRSQPGFQLIDS